MKKTTKQNKFMVMNGILFIRTKNKNNKYIIIIFMFQKNVFNKIKFYLRIKVYHAEFKLFL
jgi:formylmethanofuran dehydrogenase subunit E-like metal-binding protein